ncbi:MAG: biotin--[Alphaproteobacteria bacterium]|nr:biotin--[acetyl-CoA-carboxylase] ligase [Alphaproteobacteria bacterium]
MVKIISLKKIDSTNSYAKHLLNKGTNKNFIVTAEQQTAGRGRLNNRVWISPPGNLYASFVFNISEVNISINKTAVITSTVLKLLKDHINNLTKTNYIVIKPPNDLLVGNKKLCGVLVEIMYPFAIIGIGLNIEHSPIERAANLKDTFGIVVDPFDCVKGIYEQIDTALRNL